MNGFQIVSLSGSLTTIYSFDQTKAKLWMAFKLYLYQGLWQLGKYIDFFERSCEWLSNCIFIRVFDNFRGVSWQLEIVVNGFQIVSLSGSLTTLVKQILKWELLWMAFKLYLYQGLWQQKLKNVVFVGCCEWLSNCIFIRVFDNPLVNWPALLPVVNGFQIVSLSGSLTTFWPS